MLKEKGRLFFTQLHPTLVVAAVSIIIAACDTPGLTTPTDQGLPTGAADLGAYERELTRRAEEAENLLNKDQKANELTLQQTKVRDAGDTRRAEIGAETARFQATEQRRGQESQSDAQRSSAVWGTLGQVGAAAMGAVGPIMQAGAMSEANKANAEAAMANAEANQTRANAELARALGGLEGLENLKTANAEQLEIAKAILEGKKDRIKLEITELQRRQALPNTNPAQIAAYQAQIDALQNSILPQADPLTTDIRITGMENRAINPRRDRDAAPRLDAISGRAADLVQKAKDFEFERPRGSGPPIAGSADGTGSAGAAHDILCQEGKNDGGCTDQVVSFFNQIHGLVTEGKTGRQISESAAYESLFAYARQKQEELNQILINGTDAEKAIARSARVMWDNTINFLADLADDGDKGPAAREKFKTAWADGKLNPRTLGISERQAVAANYPNPSEIFESVDDSGNPKPDFGPVAYGGVDNLNGKVIQAITPTGDAENWMNNGLPPGQVVF